nr:hypothetical protein [Rhodocytophaga rosea]
MANKKTYTREFKEEAISLAYKNGNVSETARSLVYTTVYFGGGKRSWRTISKKPFRVRAIARMNNYGSYNGRING